MHLNGCSYTLHTRKPAQLGILPRQAWLKHFTRTLHVGCFARQQASWRTMAVGAALLLAAHIRSLVHLQVRILRRLVATAGAGVYRATFAGGAHRGGLIRLLYLQIGF